MCPYHLSERHLGYGRPEAAKTDTTRLAEFAVVLETFSIEMVGSMSRWGGTLNVGCRVCLFSDGVPVFGYNNKAAKFIF